jgi:hypothetical protein
MFAAGGPPPVTVKEPVAVTGVVEVLNDVLREPYRKSTGGRTTATGTTPFPLHFIKFDVPAGRRLIVETISLQVRVPINQNVLVQMWLMEGGSSIDATVQLPVQKQGTFGTSTTPDYLTATHPVMLRVDGTEFTNEISFNLVRNAEVGELDFNVSIFGYLVDIPPPSP